MAGLILLVCCFGLTANGFTLSLGTVAPYQLKLGVVHSPYPGGHSYAPQLDSSGVEVDMNDPKRSQWRKWDLHFQTPRSHGYGNMGPNSALVVNRLIQAGVGVVAVRDHHKLDATFAREMRGGKDKFTILPGIELSNNLSGDETLLSHINQQRVGSFSGLDEGHAQAAKIAGPVNWAE